MTPQEYEIYKYEQEQKRKAEDEEKNRVMVERAKLRAEVWKKKEELVQCEVMQQYYKLTGWQQSIVKMYLPIFKEL